jgi:hypothetical protein
MVDGREPARLNACGIAYEGRRLRGWDVVRTLGLAAGMSGLLDTLECE